MAETKEEPRTAKEYDNLLSSSSIFWEVHDVAVSSGAPMDEVRDLWIRGESLLAIATFAEEYGRSPSPFGEDEHLLIPIRKKVNKEWSK